METKATPLGTDFMSCADGGTEDQLRPQALCAGPLARWHKLPLALDVKIDSLPHGFARTVSGQLKHAKKSLRDVFRPSAAIETRIWRCRADEKSK